MLKFDVLSKKLTTGKEKPTEIGNHTRQTFGILCSKDRTHPRASLRPMSIHSTSVLIRTHQLSSTGPIFLPSSLPSFHPLTVHWPAPRHFLLLSSLFLFLDMTFRDLDRRSIPISALSRNT